MSIVSRKKPGFTLAEVLITLSVIGVVAALTIPVLMQNVNKNQYATQFKAANALLSTATYDIVHDNSGDLTGVFSTGDEIRNAYAAKYRTTKSCDGGSFFANCWYPNDDVKSLNGWLHLDHYNDVVDDFRVGGQGLVMANGQLLFFNTTWGFDSSCNNWEGGIGPSCVMMWLDTNGYNKPNTLGRDIFIYSLGSKDMAAWGDDTNNNLFCDPATQDSWNGMECALRLSTEGKMNY